MPAAEKTGGYREGSWVVIDQQGRRYVAFSERDANMIRDTVGGTIRFYPTHEK